MAQFEYEYSSDDRNLIVSQAVNEFDLSNGENYIRVSVYPTEGISNIVTLENGNRAIFYSSNNSTLFSINVSPFNSEFNNPALTKTLGLNSSENDFQIFQNETTNDIYIKPNEIFDSFKLPQGNYKIQIDFLKQLNHEFDFVGVANVQMPGGAIAIGPLSQPNVIPPDANVEFIDLTVSNRAAAAIYGGNADDYQFPTPLVNTIENHLVSSTLVSQLI